MLRDESIRLPSWMSQLPSSLLDTPLHEIAIPGTHNSFSFGLKPDSEIGPDVHDALRTFGRAGKGIIYKWSVTQSQSFKEQLESGVRYFDLRVAFRPSVGKIHFIHGLFGGAVEEELMEIDGFLRENPKEVVILDFNHFYSMSEDHHRDLVKSLVELFGNKVCLCVGVDSLTLNMLWENNLQVIIIYHDKIAEEMCEVWPGSCISSPWPNTPSVPKMLEYLDSTHLQDRGSHFHVCQGVLTPDTGYIISHLTGSLKNDIAKKTMPAFIDWLSSKKAGSSGVNIVIADFSDLCDFTKKVISLNIQQRQE